jgi:hypothetical protein
MILLESVPSPLRANNHYSDGTYRASGFLLLILASAVGFDLLIYSDIKSAAYTQFKWFLAFFAVMATVLFFIAIEPRAAGNTAFGLMVVLYCLYAAVYGWRLSKDDPSHWLLILIFIDVSAFFFNHARLLSAMAGPIGDAPNADHVGCVETGYEYADDILEYDNYLKLIDYRNNSRLEALERVPFLCFFSRAHVAGDPLAEEAKMQRPAGQSLPMDAAARNDPRFAPFFSASPDAPATRADAPATRADETARIVSRTYDTLELDVACSAPRLLFIRDADSPYWSAEMNGQPLPIGRAFFNFKAIPLPAGRGTIKLRFHPPFIETALCAALAAMGLATVHACRESEPRSPTR